MSFNQPRGDRNDSQYRRGGRSTSFSQKNSNYSGSSGKGGGAAAPPQSSNLQPNRSFSRKSNNVQEEQSRAGGYGVNLNSDSNSASASRPAPNGSYLQPPVPPGPNAQVTGSFIKPTTEPPPQRSSPIVNNAPSQALNARLDPAPQATPTKAPGDASKSFPIQFGSVSPGTLNVMQIPARTNSAPPSLVEQQRDQARREAHRQAAPPFPIPTAPKQQMQKKDGGASDRRENIQVPTPIPVSQPQKAPIHNSSGISMPMRYHQQVPVQFGGRMHPQGMVTTSLPMHMPMSIPLGSAPYISNIHPHQHPMQAQGMMSHHGQGMNFSPQLPHQLGSIGMGPGPQFPQLQNSKFENSRKPVKITHPDTHEELRLGNASGPRPRHNIPQGQPVIKSAHPSNYYHNPALPSAQGSPAPLNKAVNPSYQPPLRTPVTIKPATMVHGEKVNDAPSSSLVEKVVSQKPGGAISTRPNSSSNQEKSLGSLSSVSIEEPTSVGSLVTENKIKETGTKGDSVKDQGERLMEKIPSQPSVQVPGQSTSDPSFQSQSLEHTNFSSRGSSETSIPKPTSSLVSAEAVVESAKEMPSRYSAASDVPSPSSVSSIIPVAKAFEPVNNDIAIEDDNKLKTPSESASSKVSELVDNQTEVVAEKGTEELLRNCEKENTEVSSTSLVSNADESISTVTPLANSACDRNISTTEVSVCDNESVDSKPSDVVKFEEAVKPITELSRSKSSMAKKKKLKEILQKADAAGNTSDLYNAFKGPEEKSNEKAETDDSKESVVDSTQDGVNSNEKVEPDDWEDAADISTPKLENAEHNKVISDNDGDELMEKKYSRDFLMKFSEQCVDLPKGFEIPTDVADALMGGNVNISRDSQYPSPGRVVDRSLGGPRRGVVGDENRWNKVPGPLVSGRDLRMDGHGGNFRPGQGGNQGLLRNVRGGVLSGPMQPMGSQVMQRSNSDADRWQRATGFQKGFIPSPHTPAAVIHKAERKYQIGKITDEEENKQRQLKAILNKLTPQNFGKLFEQVKAVNIDNADTLRGVISQIFDKALMEPTFCEMYANFCYHLAGELPDFVEDDEKITFKRVLLNKCQEEFERGEREQEEAERDDAEGEVQQSPAEREEKRIQARRRMLGNIRLIGELYKKKMLTERIMNECITKLLGPYNNPDEENIESLCKLMSTIGEMIDHSKAKEHMDAYFDKMFRLSNNMKLSSRVRFMLKDTIDLRKNKWQQRRKVEGPKKIEDVHRDAAQERNVQAQAGRMGRGPGPGPNSSIRNRQPMDFSSRMSIMLTSPNSQMSGYRGLQQTQPRGFGIQDARVDDRHSFERTTPSVPLPHRPLGEESIMLGPQGGLARGMSSRGQPLIANTPLNGFGSVQDRSAYGTREDLLPRNNMDERSTGPNDQGRIFDRNVSFGNRDMRNTGNRSRPSSPSVTPSQNAVSDKVLPEERLREISLSTIKEYYSIKDEKEVTICVKELNAPGFYPTMISLWISDSFERKDMERDSLAKLLTNLSKTQDSLLHHDHLIKGFELVLSTLEDAVNDAPKAGEFLGRIFAKILIEDVIPFSEIGQLIYNGGEEKGSLVELGLAAEVVGTILEIVNSVKGDSFLNEIRTNPGLKLERFRPQNSKKTLRLDKFI